MTDSKKDSTQFGIDEAQVVELQRHPIDLYKILKFEGLVGSGGEAKAAIAGGQVLVNEVVETQKRKKIVSGDTIRFDDKLYRMHCDSELEPVKVLSEEERAAKAILKAKPKAKIDWRKKRVSKKAGRKAIGIKS
tara:strand:- start:688 stop:1089 length:402 start_codon:yes stop_codon:yes gene_type:complete